jgi:glycosyltransferase involved in cell wall biosynthesis
MPVVLHVLPHPGGGAETYLDRLAAMEGFEQRRTCLADARSPVAALPSLVRRRPEVGRAAEAADLVHIHGDTASLLALRLLRRRPSVITTHGLHLLRRARGPALAVARRRWALAAAAAERVICTSAAEYGELARIFSPGVAERLVVVRNGIQLPSPPSAAERSGARAGLGLGATDVAVVYLGELETRKDPLAAVAAVERAHAEGAPLVLLVAGDGPLRAEVDRRAGPAVRVLGFRDDPEVLLAAADALVMPSRREGVSMAVLEAMGRAVPVVAAGSPGNAETLADAGLLTPVGDSVALSRALAALAADPARRADLGARGRTRVGIEFSAERMVAATRTVYEQALRAPGPAGAAEHAAA